MTNETRHAFEHPEARAAASEGAAPRDRISLREHVVEVEIGAFQTERGVKQRVRFDIVLEVGRHDAARTDDVDQILSYDTLVNAIRAELAAERVNLLETLAERIADRILREPLARRAFVRIEKLDRGPGALGVEIVRSARDMERLPEEIDRDGAPPPRVVFLSNAAIASDLLAGWLDEFEAAEAPAILCVGLPEAVPPRSSAPAAQRRIDLLAIEQNAWVLAGRDRRCIVTGTRAEFDWAQRNHRMTVWAPSKLVLDTPEAPRFTDPRALALWFAERMQACELVVVGTTPPETGMPVRVIELP
jgi:dihydroneopterin aldolase